MEGTQNKPCFFFSCDLKAEVLAGPGKKYRVLFLCCHYKICIVYCSALQLKFCTSLKNTAKFVLKETRGVSVL